MIEVEKRYKFDIQAKERLIKSARFVSNLEYRDIYYDKSDCDLLRQDIYLRNRNGQFELKLPVKVASRHTGTPRSYEEVENEDEIRRELAIGDAMPIIRALKQHGYSNIAEYKIFRSTYRIDDLRIDIDEMDYGYEMIEIEILVDDLSDIGNAEKRIEEIATVCGLDSGYIHGKLEEYCRRFNPEIFNKVFRDQ